MRNSFFSCRLYTALDAALYALLVTVAALYALWWYLFLFGESRQLWLHLVWVNLARHIPEKDCTFGADCDHESLVWWYLYLADASWMALSFVITNALIVIVNSQLSVLAAWEEMLSLSCQVNCVQLFLWAFNRSDDCAIVLFPVSDLSVGTSCQNLIFFVVKKGLLESCWFEQAKESCVIFQVPNNTWSVTACWNSLWVVFVDLDWPNTASVFFQWGFHDLSLLGDSPNSDLTFSTAWNDSVAICSCSYRRASVIMSVIDDVKQFTRLGQEGSDLTITPSWDDWLSIMHEKYAVALKAWDLNSQEFLSVFGIPDSDFVDRGCSKNVREALRESNVVNSFVVASVSQFWG